MAGIDPMEGLLALGVVTHEQMQEAQKVDPDIASTIIGRLIAVGVPAPELLQALSTLTGVPLATRAQLDAIGPMDGFSGAVERGLRDLPAAPMTRAADGTVDVVVADPEAAKRVGPLIARHRVFLALELEVRDAIDRAIPDSDEDEGAPAPAPVPAPFAPPRGPHDGSAISIVRASAPAEEPPDVVVDAPVPMERAKPVREKYAPGVKRQDLMAPASAPPEPAPLAPAAARADVSGPSPSARPKTESRPMPAAAKKSSRTPLLAAAAAAVVAIIVAVVVLPGLGKSAAPAAPVDELALKQQKGLAEARAFAAKADHAWAITRCSDVVAAGPRTTLGKQAAVVCATERVALGEMEGISDLQKLVDSLLPTDPDRPAAEAALANLKAAHQ